MKKSNIMRSIGIFFVCALVPSTIGKDGGVQAYSAENNEEIIKQIIEQQTEEEEADSPESEDVEMQDEAED